MNEVPSDEPFARPPASASDDPAPPSADGHLLTDLLIGSGILAGAAALDNTLEAREAERAFPPIGSLLDIDGIKVHALDRGSGPPVVLLHGNGTMVHDWVLSGLLDRLAERHRVVAIDRPGYGYTERPRDRVWTAAAQAELMRQTMRALGVERPVIVGHSWGTLVSVALALAHPDEIAGLVLLSGYYFPTGRIDVWAFAPPAIPVVGDLMRYTVSPIVTGLLVPRIVAKSFEPRPVPERFEKSFPIGLCLRPSQIRGSAEDSGLLVPEAKALAGRYGELDGRRVVLMTGDGDEVVTPEHHSLRLHRELPGSELSVLPGLGHMLHYFAHDDIAEAVASVAARAGSASAGYAKLGEATKRPVSSTTERR